MTRKRGSKRTEQVGPTSRVRWDRAFARVSAFVFLVIALGAWFMNGLVSGWPVIVCCLGLAGVLFFFPRLVVRCIQLLERRSEPFSDEIWLGEHDPHAGMQLLKRRKEKR